MVKVLTNIRRLVDAELVETLKAADFSKLTETELEGYLMDVYCPIAQSLRCRAPQLNLRIIIEKESCLFGAQDSDKLITEVKFWNLWLKTNLSNLMTEWDKEGGQLNSCGTNRILEGAHMVNNEFVAASGCRGLYLPDELGILNWSTVLTQDTLDDICKNPSNYAIMNIFV